MTGVEAALAGGFIGGSLGVVSTLVASYFGPRKLEQWREERQEAREFGPRKDLLRRMLLDKDRPIRSLEILTHVTGTTDEECRRLLIEIGARGVLMQGRKEGWALIDRYPLDRNPDAAEPEAGATADREL